MQVHMKEHHKEEEETVQPRKSKKSKPKKKTKVKMCLLADCSCCEAPSSSSSIANPSVVPTSSSIANPSVLPTSSAVPVDPIASSSADPVDPIASQIASSDIRPGVVIPTLAQDSPFVSHVDSELLSQSRHSSCLYTNASPAFVGSSMRDAGQATPFDEERGNSGGGFDSMTSGSHESGGHSRE